MSDANPFRLPPGALPPQRKPDDGFVGPLNELLAGQPSRAPAEIETA